MLSGNTLKFLLQHPLNSPHKFRAILRYLQWQVGSRLVPGAVAYPWVNGSRFLVSPGETGLTGNIYAGLHEFPDMGFLLHFLRDEDLFVDVGANVGSYTILACAAIGASGIAFEPVPDTFRRLVDNIRLNRIDDNVLCLNQGVDARPGFITFTSDGDTTNRVVAPGEHCENQVSVEVTTLDLVLAGKDPALLKIDVEGFETAVMQGAHEVLKNPMLKAVIMELGGNNNRYGFDESKLVDLMRGQGFHTCSYNPLDRSLAERGGESMDTDNMLFVRDKAFVDARLSSAPMLTINGVQF